MKNAWIIRAIVFAALALLTGWVVHHTSWVEVDETIPPSGAATKPYYSLGKIAAAAGTTVVQRSALEPMPPRDATLFLDSSFWDLFPERDAKLKAWVDGGGHLVLLARRVASKDLRWVPPTFVNRHQFKAPGAPSSAASAPGADVDPDDEDDEVPAPKPNAKPPRSGQRSPLAAPRPQEEHEVCETLVEEPGSQPAFEPGRSYQRCLKPLQYRACVDARRVPSPRATPQWELGNDDRTFAMRVGFGHGSVTVVAECLPVNNDSILRGDHALIASAVLGIRPGATLWIVDDESGEPLHAWLWHYARVPLLLTLAGIVLAVWRLMVRFGPREAQAAHARRSMGEQVRGTGEFIASNDAASLHAATRKAFDDAARLRIEGYDDRTDSDRVIALGSLLAPTPALDKAALLNALNPGPRSTQPQWLAAIAVIEHARRALLRAPSAH